MVNWSGDKPKYPAGHCQFCGYNLFSLTHDRCPECGKSRAAWVEARCEECGRTCVYPVEESDRVQACQYCKKSADVPAGSHADSEATSIVGTRLAVASFIITVTGFTVIAFPVLALLLVVPFCYFTGIKSPVLFCIPFLIALYLGIRIGLRTCRV